MVGVLQSCVACGFQCVGVVWGAYGCVDSDDEIVGVCDPVLFYLVLHGSISVFFIIWVL